MDRECHSIVVTVKTIVTVLLIFHNMCVLDLRNTHTLYTESMLCIFFSCDFYLIYKKINLKDGSKKASIFEL